MSTQKVGDWVYADVEDSDGWRDASSREDAMEKAKAMVLEDYPDDKEQNYFCIAQLVPGPEKIEITANDIIEVMSFNAPECWFDDKVTKEQEEELDQLVQGWLERHNIKPDWLDIGEIEKVEFERK